MSMSPRGDDEKDDNCIRIPVRGANQTVEVYTDELPSDYNDVVDVLKAEIAPLDIWLRFAVSSTYSNIAYQNCCRFDRWMLSHMYFVSMPLQCSVVGIHDRSEKLGPYCRSFRSRASCSSPLSIASVGILHISTWGGSLQIGSLVCTIFN